MLESSLVRVAVVQRLIICGNGAHEYCCGRYGDLFRVAVTEGQLTG